MTLASFYLLEQPILHGKLTPRLARIALPVSIVGGGRRRSSRAPRLASPRPSPIARINHQPGPCGAAPPEETSQARAELAQARAAPADPRADGLRVLVIGDSIACSLLTGLEVTGPRRARRSTTPRSSVAGSSSDTVGRSSSCPRPFAEELPDLVPHAPAARRIERAAPNAIVWWSEWETADLEVDGTRGEVRHPAGRRTVLSDRMEQVFHAGTAPGVPIVILTVPPLAAVAARSRSTSRPATPSTATSNNLYRKFAGAPSG